MWEIRKLFFMSISILFYLFRGDFGFNYSIQISFLSIMSYFFAFVDFLFRNIRGEM